nr:phosphatase PAP2 family protein [Pseudopedobacter sp.]
MDMKLKPKKIYNKLYFPSLYSLIILLLALNLISVFGKEKSFLLINQFHSSFFDYFFSYITNLGDGFIWIPLMTFTVIYHQKKWLIIVINFILSTSLAIIFKGLIFPNALRPAYLVNEGFSLHFVQGVKIYAQNSFPSGHTITAFAVAFTLILLLKKKNYYKYLFFITAFLVGFSRIYLAEHFPIDVIAGAFIGIFSTYLSVYFLSLFKPFKVVIEDQESFPFETKIYTS